MANVLVEESSLSAIADSIRAKNGTATTYKPAEMSAAIDAIPTGGGTMQSKSVSYTPTESAQSGTVTPDVGYDGLSSVSVSVGAIDDEYVGSGITRRSIADLDITGATFTAPAGYYASDADKTMMTGHMSVSATKGTVSNHAVTVTPKAAVDNAGYFATGDRTGTAVSVSASELVSGTKSISQNGTGIDVTNYEKVDVNVSGQTPTGTKNISITQNGTTTEDVAAYASAQIAVNVPNSYSASDEGKVVSNGALVAQTSQVITAPGTYDTTLINSIEVNIDMWTEQTISTGGAVTQALSPFVLYHFTGALTALTITLTPPSSGLAVYHFDFESGSTSPTLTLPQTVVMPDSFSVETGKRYEVDILNNYGVVQSW